MAASDRQKAKYAYRPLVEGYQPGGNLPIYPGYDTSETDEAVQEKLRHPPRYESAVSKPKDK